MTTERAPAPRGAASSRPEAPGSVSGHGESPGNGRGGPRRVTGIEGREGGEAGPGPDRQHLPIPDVLLGPLLDTATEVFSRLGPDEVPAVLRALTAFDRRGLASGAARQQLRRAVELDATFADATITAFLERGECRAMLDAWDQRDVSALVGEAVERADLPLLASVLYAARPPRGEFGLGMVQAAFERLRLEHELGDEVRAREAQVGIAEEARRRAEAARDDAQAEVTRLEQELREERRARRDRELRGAGEVEQATQRAREAEAAAAQARAGHEALEARANREATRGREAERQLRELRREMADREREHASEARAVRPAELEALDRATERARALVGELEQLARGVREASARAKRLGTSAERRPTPEPPPGLVADSAAGLDAMLRNRGVVLVVDGYNVSMRGWPTAAVADQRDRLVAALASLHLRLRTESFVVFDGADVEGVTPPRRPGVRVAFSRPGEEADEVIVREAGAMVRRAQVVVASSDGWVQRHAGREGAAVVSADTLLEVLRR